MHARRTRTVETVRREGLAIEVRRFTDQPPERAWGAAIRASAVKNCAAVAGGARTACEASSGV
jgi:hypothetical protein